MQGSISMYVERVYEKVPTAGAVWLFAKFPNTFIDLNRNEEDIDPGMVDGPWTGRMIPTARTKAGRGLLPAFVGANVPIYAGKIDAADLKDRIENYHRPYHAEVASILSGMRQEHGVAYHLSCHSMPAIVTADGPDEGVRRSDFDLGDRNGTTAGREVVVFLADKLRSFGFNVTESRFFAGAECVERHGRPDKGIHSIQIEMNRSLYMDEKTRLLKDDISKLQDHFAQIACDSGSTEVIAKRSEDHCRLMGRSP